MNDSKTLGNIERNFNMQFYKGIPLQQIDRGYGKAKARRFTMNNTRWNVWIPIKHLELDGTIKPNQDIDYVFASSKAALNKAGFNIVFCSTEEQKRPTEDGNPS
ncbi:hypothetical protein [Carnobacterium maltaromaticum]|uniref:hypothetical protein n=1 Tax=Carnobacterium maltaromaticum TaxID=2751 RepID=UPI0039BE01C9